jgi:hypothetical protein
MTARALSLAWILAGMAAAQPQPDPLAPLAPFLGKWSLKKEK